MIRIGDEVFILPAHSMRFGKRWAEVVAIIPTEDMPYRVTIEGLNGVYQFSRDEFITKQEYKDWLYSSKKFKITGSDKTHRYEDVVGMPIFMVFPVTECEVCGVDTTGELSSICEDCRFPLKD